jgi:hypothetical protein
MMERVGEKRGWIESLWTCLRRNRDVLLLAILVLAFFFQRGRELSTVFRR